jgi:hypothetical protein
MRVAGAAVRTAPPLLLAPCPAWPLLEGPAACGEYAGG